MHVINAMNLGGAEMVVLEHVRHAGPDVESHVCAVNDGGWALKEAERLGARTFVLGKQGGRIHAVRRLSRAMEAAGIQVANGHNPSGGFYATLAGRWARVPLVIRTEHSIHHPGRHASAYTAIVEPALTAMTDRVICVCEAVRKSQAERLGWASSRFTVVPNGISAVPIELDREAARTRLGWSGDDRVALTVASLTPAKAQVVLIEAFAEVARSIPTARLMIAGDGPLRPDLERQIRELSLGDRIALLGVRNDVPILLAAADAFVLSSNREGLSMSLLEAMRAGKPAAVTDVGGNGESVAQGVTGLVVPPANAAALAEALVTLLSDPVKAAQWGAAARRRWEQTYTADHMARSTEQLYRSELARRRSGRATGE
jgi:glycosyltransferase involved in cell wall biosynthesis